MGRPSGENIVRLSSMTSLLGGGCWIGFPESDNSTYSAPADVLPILTPADSSAGSTGRKYVPFCESCSGFPPAVRLALHIPLPELRVRPIKNSAIFSWVL